MFFKPPPDPAWRDTPLPQVMILDSQVWVFMQLLYDSCDVVRGFIQFFHWLAYLAGPETILQGFLGGIIKSNILKPGFSGPARRPAEYTGCFYGRKKDALIKRVFAANGRIFFLKSQLFHA